MRRLFGFFLIVIGAICIAWFLIVAGSFTIVALKGFVGTSGREAGGELAVSALALLAGSAIGIFIIRLGGKLATRE